MLNGNSTVTGGSEWPTTTTAHLARHSKRAPPPEGPTELTRGATTPSGGWSPAARRWLCSFCYSFSGSWELGEATPEGVSLLHVHPWANTGDRRQTDHKLKRSTGGEEAIDNGGKSREAGEQQQITPSAGSLAAE